MDVETDVMPQSVMPGEAGIDDRLPGDGVELFTGQAGFGVLASQRVAAQDQLVDFTKAFVAEFPVLWHGASDVGAITASGGA